MKLIIIGCTCSKLENLVVVLNYYLKFATIDVHIVSSISARKLNCPSLTRLGTVSAWLDSAQLISATTHHYN